MKILIGKEEEILLKRNISVEQIVELMGYKKLTRGDGEGIFGGSIYL